MYVHFKTGKSKVIALNKKAVAALKIYFAAQRSCSFADGSEALFQNNRKDKSVISRVHAWRIIKVAAKATGKTVKVSCHSLRKTFGYHAWQDGVSPVVLMDIYNHSSYDVTRCYLGVSQDDRDAGYLEIDL